MTTVSPDLAFSHVSIGTRLMAFNDRNLGKKVGWSKVKPVVDQAESPVSAHHLQTAVLAALRFHTDGAAFQRAFTFAVLKPFVVRKRFSEFDQMRNMALESLGSGAGLPTMPKKTLLASSALDPKFIQERRVGLEKYARALMQMGREKGALEKQTKAISQNPEVLAFLGVQAGGESAAVEPVRTWDSTHPQPLASVRVLRTTSSLSRESLSACQESLS